jgi:hypothetical protein
MSQLKEKLETKLKTSGHEPDEEAEKAEGETNGI